ncbi:MAG TPA: SMR family transporter [Caldimonas sp.]|jgi:multidrug transporter EmrE-like cation transporter
MKLQTFLILLAGVLLNAGAQLLLKAGVKPLGAIGAAPGTLLPGLASAITRGPVLAGLACYVLSVAIWLVALSRVDVSIAYPMLSLGYVVNAVAAWWLFGEAVGAARFAGIALILLGVLVVARS